MDDTISRQAAIDALKDLLDGMLETDTIGFDTIENVLFEVPSAEPEYCMNEWCTDCAEYDHEKWCCPRFNQVIRDAVREVKDNSVPEFDWIPVGERLPDSNVRVLVTLKDGYASWLSVDRCVNERWGYDGVIAWAELPEPYRGEQDD